MSLAGHASALVRELRTRTVRWILGHRIRARHPTLRADPTAIWDYAYRSLDDIVIGQGVTVGAYTEILVYRKSRHSAVPGRLILEDGSVVGTGVCIRAAGGTVRLGPNSGIAQNSVVVAANHRAIPGLTRLNTPWDDQRTGVELGEDVWVGASCVLLPGCRIGDHAVIAAGSVVRGVVPPNELWGGVPARKLKDLGEPPVQVRGAPEGR